MSLITIYYTSVGEKPSRRAPPYGADTRGGNLARAETEERGICWRAYARTVPFVLKVGNALVTVGDGLIKVGNALIKVGNALGTVGNALGTVGNALVTVGNAYYFV